MIKKAKKTELDDLIKKIDELELRIKDCEKALDEYLEGDNENNTTLRSSDASSLRSTSGE